MASTVLDLIAEWVRSSPDRIAVSFDRELITYRELWDSAGRLAAHLADFDVGRDDIVGIVAEPGIDMVVAIVGALRAGAGYLPLEPTYPASRLQHMLADSKPVAVLSSRAHAARLEWEPFWRAPDRMLAMVDYRASATTPIRDAPTIELAQLAYVVYTSGSTGSPKGVQIPHAGLAAMIRAQIEIFAVHPASCILQFASFSFDASVSEVFVALCAGARLQLARRSAMIPGERLLSLLREQRVTVVTLPPSVLATIAPDALPDLATIVSAGEACSESVVDAWAVGRRFVNAYGPSEVTVCASAAVCEPGSGPPPIGRALPHLRAHVLDGDLAPVPAGEPGELYLAGSALARGYAERPGATAAAFVPDPFSGDPGARMYRTGDLVTMDSSGVLRFLGRADQQVKIRGYRIEPGEIEAVLRAEPQVVDARVVPFDSGEDRGLAAYVIPRQPGELDREELRNALRAKLPAFMIPSRVIPVDAWPLTANGKLDVAALPAPRHEIAMRADTYAAPRNSTEHKLTEIWESLLDRAPIGINDDFFHLGGHSLLALRLSRRLQTTFGICCDVDAIAEHATIKRLAAHLRDPDAPTGASTIVCLQTGDAAVNPLFLAAPIHGNSLCYLPLTRLLGPDKPCFGLRPVGAPPPTIAGYAAAYIAAMRGVRRRGPYRIAGWSFGGLVAYEMARQLARTGDTVELLAIIDATVPTPEHSEHVRAALGDFPMPTMAFMFVRNTLLSVGFPVDIAPDLYERLSRAEIERDVLRRLNAIEVAPPGMTTDGVAVCLELFRSSLRAMYAYTVEPVDFYTGPAVVFAARDGHPAMPSETPCGRWDDLIAGQVTTRAIPGNHFTVCHPANVSGLATELAPMLVRT